MQERLKSILDGLFSTRAAGMYMLAFALAIAVATFIENDFGTSSAQKVVFRAAWFEVLLALFGICIIVNIRRFRMVKNRKWPVLMFHAAIIVILLGALVTRFFGYEGIMHIREGSSSNEMITSETYLIFEAEDNGDSYRFDEPVHFASLGKNHFAESYQIGDQVVQVTLEDFVPNPKRALSASETGVPTIELVLGGANGRQEYFLKYGDLKRINDTWFNFAAKKQSFAINIDLRNDSLIVNSPEDLTQMVMATQSRTPINAQEDHIFLPRALYSNEKVSFVMADFQKKGSVNITSEDRKMRNESIAALALNVSVNGAVETAYVYGNKGMEGRPHSFELGGLTLKVSYGAKRVALPFSIALRDFILDRYPGTNSPMSYASEVTLMDPPKGVERQQRIYMNHILDYSGFRFFQSSYDQDEQGTILSVNHDFWGTWISYIGYILLTVGLIWTFFSKRSRFSFLSRQLGEIRAKRAGVASLIIVFMLLGSHLSLGESPVQVISAERIPAYHYEAFGHLLVQDHRGRLKPMNTLTSEILRKVSRSESIYGLTADQIMIGMMVNSDEWIDIPLIKGGRHEKFSELLNSDAKLLPYSAFFEGDGTYLLHDYARAAHTKEPIDRTVFDKEIMKIDERINILNMVFSARLMRLYPLADDPNNRWLAPGELTHQQNSSALNDFVRKWYLAYMQTVRSATTSGDWELADELLVELQKYQQTYGGDIVISDAKINTEIALNKMRPFKRLGSIYGLLGLAFISIFFAGIFKPTLNMVWPMRIANTLMFSAFAVHTAGLAMRWYVSGHAPWSNGYESMIYIAWTTVLAGLIFSRRSIGGLSATAILASTVLMVAGLSWLDPEITPLVPVLRSYWLTIHVSLEAGSYGFLALGAIIGTLNLLAMIFMNKSNTPRIKQTIKELTYVSEMTLIGGLVMISIGTYLGGVWANESWGRYWGWDAKETWALVTILVYAFILHMRFIPGFRGHYAFNVSTLFGFASVMMTYFGVNYYLSGLHSYAAGDPVPIPTFVYYTVASLATISLLALWRWKKFAS